MKASTWLRGRVLMRAAWRRLMRLHGKVHPPDEVHPAHVQMQPSDLAAERARAAPLRMARRNCKDLPIEAWQQQARTRLTELLALEPTPDGEFPNWEMGWQRDVRGVRAQRVYLHRCAGVDIPITLVDDPSRAEPGPPLVVLLGTHSSVSLALGEARLPYDIVRLRNGADIALQAVREGYTTICVELASLGERRERRYAGGSNTGTAAEAALLFGHCLLGDRVSDLMCIVDWWARFCEHTHRAHSQPWVLGHSAGGTVALFGTAVDTRIAGCIASGCVGFIRETLLKRRNEGGQNSVPGILNWMELDDVVALIAPRPLLAVSAHDDHIWPYAGCKAVIDAASPAWQAMDSGTRVVCSAADGEHRFHPDATWPALRSLRNRTGAAGHA